MASISFKPPGISIINTQYLTSPEQVWRISEATSPMVRDAAQMANLVLQTFRLQLCQIILHGPDPDLACRHHLSAPTLKKINVLHAPPEVYSTKINPVKGTPDRGRQSTTCGTQG